MSVANIHTIAAWLFMGLLYVRYNAFVQCSYFRNNTINLIVTALWIFALRKMARGLFVIFALRVMAGVLFEYLHKLIPTNASDQGAGHDNVWQSNMTD
jgi:hypothetical protein